MDTLLKKKMEVPVSIQSLENKIDNDRNKPLKIFNVFFINFFINIIYTIAKKKFYRLS